jgi:hypothetical protein
VRIIDLDGTPVNKWRYGVSRWALDSQLRLLQRSGWRPDRIFIECFTTFWWEGAAEAVATAKRRFPDSTVSLLGAYAALAAEHAKEHSLADEVISQPPRWLSALPTDLSVYPEIPSFAFVATGDGTRTTEEIVEEIVVKAARRQVRHFAFEDHAIARRFGSLYRSVLERLVERKLRICWYALGNIAPGDLVEQPDLADLMRRAGYIQIWFSDDRDTPPGSHAFEQLSDSYAAAAEFCHAAGFPQRAEALNGTLCVGRGMEDIAERARLAAAVASRIGSITLWPYQPSPQECSGVALEDQNGKLFPLRTQSGLTYEEYLRLFAVVGVLSSKYRTRTFDFLGDGLIPRLLRDSLRREAWDPDPSVKGGLQLPVVIRR